MGLKVDSYLLPTSKSRDTKTRTKINKSGSDKFYVLPPKLRIRGHLPAPTVNGVKHKPLKMAEFPTFKGS